MERLGFAPEAVHKENPALVYGRITGWGQEGPRSSLAGHDLNYIGVSGALWYASEPSTPPFTPPTLTGDIGGGAMYLVTGMLAGLLKAKSTGKGCVVDAAIVDGSAHTMNLLMSTRAAGLLNDERGLSYLDGPPWSRCYASADGRWLSVQCLEPRFYAEFLDRLGLGDDPDFQQNPDPASWPALTERLKKIFAGHPLQHWLSLFENSDACIAPVLSPVESRQDPHMLTRQTWVEKGGQLQARAAPRFDGQLPDEPGEAPVRGEHTEEILAQLES